MYTNNKCKRRTTEPTVLSLGKYSMYLHNLWLVSMINELNNIRSSISVGISYIKIY